MQPLGQGSVCLRHQMELDAQRDVHWAVFEPPADGLD
jgi:hypothetical protein